MCSTCVTAEKITVTNSKNFSNFNLFNKRQRLWWGEITSRWTSKYKFFIFGNTNLKLVSNQVASWSIQPFGHNRHGPKLQGCATFGGGELGPHLTQCGLRWGLPPRQVSFWSIQLFGHNIPMSQTDRPGQRSDSKPFYKWSTKNQQSTVKTVHMCVYYCAQLYTTQHRTVLIIFPSYPPDNHYSPDDVYWRGQGQNVMITHHSVM